MSKNTKRYLVSSLITFISSFLLAITPLVDQLTVDNIGRSAIFAILIVGVRAGVKAVSEWFVANVNI